MNDEIMLSIIILSYKQEKYIREAIDSVLSQKVNFKYELLLADDYSCDGTLDIMKEYAKKNNNVKVLERKRNLGCSDNLLDAVKRTKGKYITFLEGDDYWIDDNKLQKQVDFLENNKEFVAVSHLQEGRNLMNESLGNFPRNIKEDFIIDGVDDLLNDKVFSSSATLYINIYKDKKMYEEMKYLKSFHRTIGDTQTCTYLASLGKIKVFAKPMMVYRVRSNDGQSNFNSTHKINEIEYDYMNIYVKLEEYFDYKYSFYYRIKKSYTLGVLYDLTKFNFKDIKKFNDLCPKKYKLKIILSFPFKSISLVFSRFIKKR